MDVVYHSKFAPLQTATDMYSLSLVGVVLITIVSTILILACAMACAKWSREHPLYSEDAPQEGIFIDGSQDLFPSDFEQHDMKADPQRVTIPSRCPNCGISISHDDLTWTGPLQGSCPSCGTTIRASVYTN